MDQPLRLVLVDDHQIVLDGLRSMLRPHARAVTVVAVATDADAALAAVAEHFPDVVLLDVRLGNDSGLEVCERILERSPEQRVVFLTVYDDEQYLYRALRAGAVGYLLKRVTGRELVAHLEAVHAGTVVIDPTLAGRVAQSAARLQSGEFWPGAHLGLTRRESEVLAGLVSGRSNRDIAADLVLSADTIKTHLRSMYRKLAVSDRSQAVAAALREGLFR
ncbi:MAG: response regulator transcription factor [Actinomycetota bacterium]|nr:response regulator transcription factor [Actinomycetota bacterium]